VLAESYYSLVINLPFNIFNIPVDEFNILIILIAAVPPVNMPSAEEITLTPVQNYNDLTEPAVIRKMRAENKNK
jgi:hypothetical protein